MTKKTRPTAKTLARRWEKVSREIHTAGSEARQRFLYVDRMAPIFASEIVRSAITDLGLPKLSSRDMPMIALRRAMIHRACNGVAFYGYESDYRRGRFSPSRVWDEKGHLVWGFCTTCKKPIGEIPDSLELGPWQANQLLTIRPFAESW